MLFMLAFIFLFTSVISVLVWRKYPRATVVYASKPLWMKEREAHEWATRMAGSERPIRFKEFRGCTPHEENEIERAQKTFKNTSLLYADLCKIFVGLEAAIAGESPAKVRFAMAVYYRLRADGLPASANTWNRAINVVEATLDLEYMCKMPALPILRLPFAYPELERVLQRK